MKRKIESDLIGPAEASLFRSTDQIKNDVEELIDLNDDIQAQNLDVSVDEHGVVTLRGLVSNRLGWDEAESAAHEVLGVTGVRNELEIAP